MKFRKSLLTLALSLLMLVSLFTLPAFGAAKGTAAKGTPKLGTNDPLWQTTEAISVSNSNAAKKTTGEARVLWDDNFLYVRVVVSDSDVYTKGGISSEQWMYDAIELFVGAGSSGSNQYRVNSTGEASSQTAAETWTNIEDPGYVVEYKIAKGSLVFKEDAVITFDVQIHDSTAKGGDRFATISAFGTPDAGYSSSDSFTDTLQLVAAGTAAPAEETPAVPETPDEPEEVAPAPEKDPTSGKYVVVELDSENPNWINNTNQKGWNIHSENSPYNADQFNNAEYLVLEFEADIANRIDILWQYGPDWGWNDKTFEEGCPALYIVDIRDMFGDDYFQGEEGKNIGFAFWNDTWEDSKLVRAYLASDKPYNAPTETPEPEVTPEPEPEVTPEPTPEITPEPVPIVTPEPDPIVTPEPAPVVTPAPAPVITPAPVPAPAQPGDNDDQDNPVIDDGQDLGNKENPTTGDSALLFIAMAALVLAGGVSIILIRKKKVTE